MPYCVDQQLHSLIIETDSLLLKRIVEGEWETPWCIGTKVKRIKEVRNHFNVIFQYVLREGNVVTDCLANLVFSFAGTILFQSFTKLPSAGMKLINLDKAQILNLRVRVAKRKAPD